MAKKVEISALDFVATGCKATEIDWLRNERKWREKGVSQETHAQLSADICGSIMEILYGDNALSEDEILDLVTGAFCRGARS